MRAEIFWLILGMAAVTFLPRFLPMALLTRWTISKDAKLLLSYLPVAIVSAIAIPMIFPFEGNTLVLSPQLLLSALVSAAFAIWQKNLWGTVLLGMLSYWLLGMVF